VISEFILPGLILTELISGKTGAYAESGVLAILAEGEAGSSSFLEQKGMIFLFMIVIAIAIAIAILFLVMRISSRRTTRVVKPSMRESRPKAGDDSPNVHGSAHPELEKLYVDLHEFSRETEARIDTKITYLKGLIDEAERVGAQLEGTIDSGEGKSDQSHSQSATRPAPESTPEKPESVRTASTPKDIEDVAINVVEDSNDDDHKVEAIPEGVEPESVLDGDEKAELRGEIPTDYDQPDEEQREPAQTLGQTVDVRVGPEPAINDQVIERYRKGQNAGDIASALGIQRGEVELMINLAQSSNEKA
jgi:hypothetical protein